MDKYHLIIGCFDGSVGEGNKIASAHVKTLQEETNL
jgi:hypothetical protein